MEGKTCANCEEEVERLVEPAFLKLPVDLSALESGDEFDWQEPGKFKETYTVIEVRGEKLAYPYESEINPVCVECFTHAVWPSLYPYIANKPPQILLDGWKNPVWAETL